MQSITENFPPWVEQRLRLARVCDTDPIELEFEILIFLSQRYLVVDVWVPPDLHAIFAYVRGANAQPDDTLFFCVYNIPSPAARQEMQ